MGERPRARGCGNAQPAIAIVQQIDDRRRERLVIPIGTAALRPSRDQSDTYPTDVPTVGTPAAAASSVATFAASCRDETM